MEPCVTSRCDTQLGVITGIPVWGEHDKKNNFDPLKASCISFEGIGHADADMVKSCPSMHLLTDLWVLHTHTD